MRYDGKNIAEMSTPSRVQTGSIIACLIVTQCIQVTLFFVDCNPLQGMSNNYLVKNVSIFSFNKVKQHVLK